LARLIKWHDHLQKSAVFRFGIAPIATGINQLPETPSHDGEPDRRNSKPKAVVCDVRVEGERLEGRGVMPDVVVPFRLPYAAGHDPQLDAARGELAQAS
jgi:hypothetical protein